MDNLHEVNPTIIERLNGLLDIKYDEGNNKEYLKKIGITENPLKNLIEIDKNFRIIGICDIEGINRMSPTFLNRFIIIFLENLLKKLPKEDLSYLLKIIFNRKEEEERAEIDQELDDFFGDLEENEEISEEINGDQILINEININYLTNKIICDINTSLTLSDITRLCYSIKKISNMKEFRKIPKKHLIDFIYDLLFSEKEVKINANIKYILLELLNK